MGSERWLYVTWGGEYYLLSKTQRLCGPKHYVFLCVKVNVGEIVLKCINKRAHN